MSNASLQHIIICNRVGSGVLNPIDPDSAHWRSMGWRRGQLKRGGAVVDPARLTSNGRTHIILTHS
eukprot:1220077-Pyramimonas_sp.AAC.1